MTWRVCALPQAGVRRGADRAAVSVGCGVRRARVRSDRDATAAGTTALGLMLQGHVNHITAKLCGLHSWVKRKVKWKALPGPRGLAA